MFPDNNASNPAVARRTPAKTIWMINKKKNHRRTAPPIAEDRFLKIVEKNREILKKIKPKRIVAPIKIRYAAKSTFLTLTAMMSPAVPNPMTIVRVRTPG